MSDTQDDTVPDDNHRGMARMAGYYLVSYYQERADGGRDFEGTYVKYDGPDASRRALRDIGPFDNEADAWARAIGLAQTYRHGA